VLVEGTCGKAKSQHRLGRALFRGLLGPEVRLLLTATVVSRKTNNLFGDRPDTPPYLIMLVRVGPKVLGYSLLFDYLYQLTARNDRNRRSTIR
jgi:hypothetical protein